MGWAGVLAPLLALVSIVAPRPAAAGDAPLPPWATMPAKQQPAREIGVVEKRGDVLGTIAGAMPVRLLRGDRLLQIGSMRWTTDQLGTLAVRLENDQGWLEAVARADDLLLPLPVGTAGAAEPAGPAMAMTLAAARFHPVAHRGRHTRMETVPEPADEALGFWVADERLEITAAAAPVPAAWRRPGPPLSRRGPPDTCDLELFHAPGLDPAARPFRKLTVCEGGRMELRVAERRGGWTRLWVRERPRAPLAFTGWIRTPKPFGAAACACGLGGLGSGPVPLSASGSHSVYFALRDLPLYAKADRAARPVGVLLKERYEFKRETMPAPGPGAPDFVPVTLHEARLWVPYRPAYFEYRRVNR